MTLRPFWRHYGAKWKTANRYDAPKHRTVVEPFAGGAGYSLRHYTRDVVLVEKNAKIAELWRWLIGASDADVMSVPCNIRHIDELPSSTSTGARLLVSACLANARPNTFANKISPMASRDSISGCGGWSAMARERVARQVGLIKHWKIIEGSYESAPDIDATWFVDPPYERKGVGYTCGSKDIDFSHLADWCRSRRGQTIVCENDGATWLPFRRAFEAQSCSNAVARRHVEAIWTNY